MRFAFLIAACAFSLQASYSQPVKESSPQKIKVLSWNIYMMPGFLSRFNGERAREIGQLLATGEYDVLVFEEAFCQMARHAIRKQTKSQFPFEAGPANRRLFSLKTNSGLWILSRYPILSAHSIVFRTRYGVDALSRKGALLVELDIHGKRIQVAGTHLQNSGDASIRRAQCVEFYERLLKPNEREGIPQIICGDFNINKFKATESYQFMLAALDAVDGDFQGEKRYSYDRLNNDLHAERGTGQDLIDYILLRDNGDWINCVNRQIRTLRKRWHARHEDLSDHSAIQAEIYFTQFPTVVTSR